MIKKTSINTNHKRKYSKKLNLNTIAPPPPPSPYPLNAVAVKFKLSDGLVSDDAISIVECLHTRERVK